jgi:23S rRNA (adenine2503-C2)-methyltransferase
MTSAEFVADRSERGRGEALAAYRRLFREAAAAAVGFELPDIAGELREGETIKFLLRLHDGRESESVIIPMRTTGGAIHHTLCVSSQIGCAMGCTFCETGQMGLLRDLSAGEILAQWFVARHVYGAPIRNIVFMGMGEPMENFDSVERAIRVLTDRNGPAIAPAHIAVSTVGRVAGIDRYRQLASEPGLRQLKLAISVNAPRDAVRSSIMPINRAEPMHVLRAAMERWLAAGLSSILVEYVLIPGVNDATTDAGQLADFLRGLSCKLNVIPYNPRRNSPWPAPSEERVKEFIAALRQRGLFVKRRRTLGRSVMAACGQLGNELIRRRKLVAVTAHEKAPHGGAECV